MGSGRDLHPPARIFLLGCARSGTTVAQKLISEALGALTVPETNFFPALCGDFAFRVYGRRTAWHPPSLVRAALDVTWPRRRQVQSALDSLAASVSLPPPAAGPRISDCTDAFIACLDAAADKAGVAGWLEKSPSHLYYVDYIGDAVPGALFVHILRNGIDTVASLQDAGRKYAGAGNNFSANLGENIARWNQAMRWHRRYAATPGHVLVGFDTLGTRNWPATLGVPSAGLRPGQVMPPISHAHEVWKADAISGALQAPESKRNLLSAIELRRLQAELLCGGDIGKLFPGVHAG